MFDRDKISFHDIFQQIKKKINITQDFVFKNHQI